MSCFAQIRHLKHLRGKLTCHAALKAVNALVGSRFDCFPFFSCLSAFDLCKLQCVQNSLARTVTNTTKYSFITPVRKTPHWLPIEHRSIFKTCLLVYKFPYGGYSKYLYLSLDLDIVSITHIKAKLIVCSWRSHTLSLSVYKSSKHFGLSFAYDDPKILNNLPDDVHSATSLHPFRNKLKTYLFAQAYPP